MFYQEPEKFPTLLLYIVSHKSLDSPNLIY